MFFYTEAAESNRLAFVPEDESEYDPWSFDSANRNAVVDWVIVAFFARTPFDEAALDVIVETVQSYWQRDCMVLGQHDDYPGHDALIVDPSFPDAVDCALHLALNVDQGIVLSEEVYATRLEEAANEWWENADMSMKIDRLSAYDLPVGKALAAVPDATFIENLAEELNEPPSY